MSALLIATILIFGGCAEEMDQRAVQPGQVASSQAAPQFAPATPTERATPVPSASPFLAPLPTIGPGVAQPTATRIYFTDGGDLWQLPVESGGPSPVLTGHSILAFAPSPDGEQVAVIYLSGDSGEEHLADFRPDGTSVIDVGLTVPADDQSSRGGDIQSLAWSPTGDRVAVARQDGSISVVTNDGAITQIVSPDKDRFPGELGVSPDGRTLLYLDPALPGRATSLYTIPIEGGTTPSKLVNGSSHPVLVAKWLPHSNRIAYVQAVATSPPGTGDVFLVDTGTSNSELAVPSAQFAPVAGVADIAFSVEGNWTAFTVYVPSDSGSRFLGLWLKNLKTGVRRQVTIEVGDAVSDVWWGQGTLLYRTVKASESSKPKRYTGLGPYALYSVNPDDGQPTLRHDVP